MIRLNPRGQVYQSLLILSTGVRHRGKLLQERDPAQGEPDEEQPPTDEGLNASFTTMHVSNISAGGASVNEVGAGPEPDRQEGSSAIQRSKDITRGPSRGN